jgi:lipopolysaccharide export system protein LptA
MAGLLLPVRLHAQTLGAGGGKIEIQHASTLHAVSKHGQEEQHLNGNVVFRQGDVTMSCDSAIFYSGKNKVNAFGNIDINQHDSVHLYGQQLDYDGNTKYAIVRKDVRMTDRKMVLTTDRLDYDMQKKEAFYTSGGVLTDDENRLTSQVGYYFSESKDMYFKKDVVLTNPKYIMNCDTLQYNVLSRKAIFHGPTTIKSDKDLIYCETGWYHTLKNVAQFGKNAFLQSGNQQLFGDSMYYDRKRGYGRAINNIRVVDTSEKLIVHGNYAEHFENEKRTYITRNVLVSKGLEKDTLFLTSDTVRSQYDTSGKYRILRAYQHVRVYNLQFQAVCDTLIYSFVDSTMDLRVNPAFWFGGYQSTADRILIHTHHNRITQADLTNNSFMSTKEDSLRYSQIKGRNMIAHFANNELKVVDVNGNGESVYYVKDDKKAYIGVNKINSSNIKIGVKDRKIDRINFIKDPDAVLTPIKKADPRDLILKGFKWRGSEQPKSLEDLTGAKPDLKVPAPPQKQKPKVVKKKKVVRKRKVAPKKAVKKK